MRHLLMISIAAVTGLATVVRVPVGNAAESAASTGRVVHRLTLTPAQEKAIYQSVLTKPVQRVPKSGAPLQLGDTLPRSITSRELPEDAHNVLGSGHRYHYAKVQEGQLLIVEPQTSIVVRVIESQEK
jgi:hypothetical protein